MSRKRSRLYVAALVSLSAAAIACAGSLYQYQTADLIHTEPSEFSPVLVYEQRGERCIAFDKIDQARRQTCMSLHHPQRMVFHYSRMEASALFVHPDPRRILVVGLGGGTIQKMLASVLPEATIHSVEIDPAVVRVAEQYFGFEKSERQQVFVEDGRAFIERARAQGEQYDLVMLDAFDEEYIPPRLLTVEFLQAVKEILSPDGVLVSNTFSTSQTYDRESATYETVYGDFFNLRDRNRVIIATPGTLPSMEVLSHNAAAWKSRLKAHGVDADRQLGLYSIKKDWDEMALPIWDDEVPRL